MEQSNPGNENEFENKNQNDSEMKTLSTREQNDSNVNNDDNQTQSSQNIDTALRRSSRVHKNTGIKNENEPISDKNNEQNEENNENVKTTKQTANDSSGQPTRRRVGRPPGKPKGRVDDDGHVKNKTEDKNHEITVNNDNKNDDNNDVNDNDNLDEDGSMKFTQNITPTKPISNSKDVQVVPSFARNWKKYINKYGSSNSNVNDGDVTMSNTKSTKTNVKGKLVRKYFTLEKVLSHQLTFDKELCMPNQDKCEWYEQIIESFVQKQKNSDEKKQQSLLHSVNNDSNNNDNINKENLDNSAFEQIYDQFFRVPEDALPLFYFGRLIFCCQWKEFGDTSWETWTTIAPTEAFRKYIRSFHWNIDDELHATIHNHKPSQIKEIIFNIARFGDPIDRRDLKLLLASNMNSW